MKDVTGIFVQHMYVCMYVCMYVWQWQDDVEI